MSLASMKIKFANFNFCRLEIEWWSSKLEYAASDSGSARPIATCAVESRHSTEASSQHGPDPAESHSRQPAAKPGLDAATGHSVTSHQWVGCQFLGANAGIPATLAESKVAGGSQGLRRGT